MILEETLNKLIRDVVNLLVGQNDYTIKAKQKNAPRPKNAYADVDFMSDTAVGWEQRKFENNSEDPDLTETIEGSREIMFSIGFYRDNAVDNARKVRIGLIRESIQDLFRSAKVGLGSRSEVREISEQLEDGWEERGQFDLVLNAVGTDADIVRSIETVDMAGVFQSRGLEYQFNISNE